MCVKILDRMLRTQQFTPSTTEEYIALQLAKRLGEEAAINRYVRYAAQYPVIQLVRTFHKVKGEAQAFYSFLTSHDS